MKDSKQPIVTQWERGRRAHCPDCTWTTKNLPFPDPDAALHALHLHGVLCKGPARPTAIPLPPVSDE